MPANGAAVHSQGTGVTLPMRDVCGFRGAIVVAVISLIAFSGVAMADGLGAFNQRLDAIEPQVSQAVADAAMAGGVINRLDEDEADFAQLAESSHYSRDRLLDSYSRLEEMLNRIYTTYNGQKEACIRTIDNGGSCDYDHPERLALRALYPLSWLRFQGAMLYADDPSLQRRLLNQAIDGFTDSTLLIVAPQLVRENLLGRAFCERELGKFEHAEYAKAIADFKRIMRAGPYTHQYRPAQQGLATTYAAMGQMNRAQNITGQLANGATGAQREGLEMLRLREMFRAEQAITDPAKRARQHREIMDYLRARQHEKNGWAVAVAAAADYVSDPVTEFGNSSDPFEIYLLANVLYYKHHRLEAAHYYWQAARSGQYPKAYRYAADLYYAQGHLDTVRQIVDQVAAQRGGPDAQWAAYMRFKIPRLQWERGGMHSAELERAWIAGAREYLKEFPHGRYAYEPRFRLGEALQRQGDFINAAAMYARVSGSPDYDYTARYNAAECYYEALKRADHQGAVPVGAHAAVKNAELRRRTIDALHIAIAAEPAAERGAKASQRQRLRQSRGRAIFMLANLLEREP
ncbi:MAG: tetratricopeptide repeat protein, partial [Candidatus Binataceae bacterium]